MQTSLTLPVLGFHHISDEINYYTSITSAAFVELIADLATTHEFLSLKQIQTVIRTGAPVSPKGLLLTFDDAYADIYPWLLSMQHHYQATGVVFVITRYIGRRNEWNLKSPYFADHLTWEQLDSLFQAGYEIGSHTASHPNLIKLSSAELEYQLDKSKQLLESHFQAPVFSLAYPYGVYNETVKAYAAKYYTLAFSTQTKSLTMNWLSDLYSVRRIMVTRESTLAGLRALIDEYAAHV